MSHRLYLEWQDVIWLIVSVLIVMFWLDVLLDWCVLWRSESRSMISTGALSADIREPVPPPSPNALPLFAIVETDRFCNWVPRRFTLTSSPSSPAAPPFRRIVYQPPPLASSTIPHNMEASLMTLFESIRTSSPTWYCWDANSTKDRLLWLWTVCSCEWIGCLRHINLWWRCVLREVQHEKAEATPR